ncbi:MAG: thioredoxin fold domain-containing protein [Spirochaetota bacterium]
MKYKLILIFIITVFILGCPESPDSSEKVKPQVAQNAQVKWESFNAGMSKALGQKKPVIIDFYADWCHWCKVMDRETFSNEEVTKILNRDFIAIRIDTQRRESITYKGNMTTADRFAPLLGVSGLPTVVFMDEEGNLIDKVPGFIKPDVFTGILRYISEGCYKLKVSFADYMSKKAGCGK